MYSIPIVFSSDHAFLVPTLVAIHSLLKSRSYNTIYDIILLISKDFNELDQSKILEQVKFDSPDSKVKFVLPTRDFSSVFIKDRKRFSEVTYYRLFIPWIVPEYDKVVYADGDIIFNSDLSSLYNNFELGENYFAGVNKSSYQEAGERLKNILALGLNPEKYVNAGFLIVNSKIQREHNLFQEFEKYLSNEFKFFDQDQDIINIVAKNRIASLPMEYNLSPDYIFKEKIKDYKLIHFTVGGKPWNNMTWGMLEWWNQYKDLQSFDEEYYFMSLHKIYQKTVKDHKIASRQNFTKYFFDSFFFKITEFIKKIFYKFI